MGCEMYAVGRVSGECEEKRRNGEGVERDGKRGRRRGSALALVLVLVPR